MEYFSGTHHPQVSQSKPLARKIPQGGGGEGWPVSYCTIKSHPSPESSPIMKKIVCCKTPQLGPSASELRRKPDSASYKVDELPCLQNQPNSAACAKHSWIFAAWSTPDSALRRKAASKARPSGAPLCS